MSVAPAPAPPLPDRAPPWHELEADLQGELLLDEGSRAIYSSGASIYHIRPRAIVRAQHAEDLQAALRFATRHRLPITARGAGTGLAGQSVGPGLILDASRLSRVLRVDYAAQEVEVEPGVVCGALNRVLNARGHYFSPDPSSAAYITLGGMVANNSGGNHSVKYGSTREYVRALDGYFADGEPVRIEPVPHDRGRFPSLAPGRLRELALFLWDLVTREAATIEAHRPKTRRNSSGYALERLLDGERFDLPQLITGSEGTLMIFSRLTLGIRALPKAGAGLAFYCGSLEDAGQAIVRIREHGPSCLEILDRTFLDLVQGEASLKLPPLPEGTVTMLIVEFDGDDQQAVNEAASACMQRIVNDLKLALSARAVFDAGELAQLWKVRKAASPILSRQIGTVRPTRFIEDAAVAPERVPELILGLRDLCERHQAPGPIFAHAGEGALHVNPLLDPTSERGRATMRAMASEHADLVKSLGGTLSGEHADGRLRAPYLERMFGPLYHLFLAVKRRFDPLGILNPGVKFPLPGQQITDHLRYQERGAEVKAFDGFTARIAQVVDRCHGCGQCRDYCPVMAAGPQEEHSARSKAGLMRAALRGEVGERQAFFDEDFAQSLDLCLNCKRCLDLCPTQVDIPGLALEFRAWRVGQMPMSPVQKLLCAPEKLGAANAALAPLANRALALPLVRTVMEKLLGVAAARKMPTFGGEPGVRGTPHSALRTPHSPSPGPRIPIPVIYFPGCHARYTDPGGEAPSTRRVLEALGCRVETPDLVCCGISRHTAGARAEFLALARENLARLKPFLDAGATIVFSAPSCRLALAEELPKVWDAPETRALAKNCVDVHDFVLTRLRENPSEDRMKTEGPRMDLEPAPFILHPSSFIPSPQKIVFHRPCHMHAGTANAAKTLLARIPGVEVEQSADLCCGMSGTFGVKTANFERSLAIGATLAEDLRAHSPDLVASPCGTCQMQIRQTTDFPFAHPMTILARHLAQSADMRDA